jgi:hypothetical protein
MRRQDWPQRLAEFNVSRRRMPFTWGGNDCVTLAADWIEQATGTDPIADIRGWTDALSAARTIEALGGLEAAITARLGEPIPPAFARRGDVVLLDIAGRETVGVVVPMGVALAAWRVG